MIDFTPLHQSMKAKSITGYRLTKIEGFGHGTWQNILKGKSVNLSTINQLCVILDCHDISEIIQYVETSEDRKYKKLLNTNRWKIDD